VLRDRQRQGGVLLLACALGGGQAQRQVPDRHAQFV